MFNTEGFDATQLPGEDYDETSDFFDDNNFNDFDDFDDFDDDDDSGDDDFDEHEAVKPTRSSRFKGGHFVQYPTGKSGRYSKDRRHVSAVKKSDKKKMTVRSAGGKGAKHRKKNRENP